MQFFSIKFKNIFQKIRYNKGISLSSIADKENRRISLTGRNPLVSRKNRDTNGFKRETDILSPSLSCPIDFPAIFCRSKMDDLLKLFEEICCYFMISAIYPIIESAKSNGLVSSTSKVCPSKKIHLSIVPEYFNVQIIFSLCMIAKDLWLATFG